MREIEGYTTRMQQRGGGADVLFLKLGSIYWQEFLLGEAILSCVPTLVPDRQQRVGVVFLLDRS